MSTVNTSMHFIVVIGWIIVGQFVLIDRWTHRLRCPLVFKGSFGQFVPTLVSVGWAELFNHKGHSIVLFLFLFLWLYTHTSNIMWVLFIFFCLYLHIYTGDLVYVIFSFPNTNCFIKHSVLWFRLFLCLSIKDNHWLPTLYRPPPDCPNHKHRAHHSLNLPSLRVAGNFIG